MGDQRGSFMNALPLKEETSTNVQSRMLKLADLLDQLAMNDEWRNRGTFHKHNRHSHSQAEIRRKERLEDDQNAPSRVDLDDKRKGLQYAVGYRPFAGMIG